MPKRQHTHTEHRPFQDLTTGDVHVVAVRSTPRHKEPFTIVFQKPLYDLLVANGKVGETDTPLKPLDWRVLLYLVVSCGYENRLDRFKTEIANDLHHDAGSVTKSLTRLEARGLIQLIDNNPGRPWTIVLNPDLFFRGRKGQRDRVSKEYHG